MPRKKAVKRMSSTGGIGTTAKVYLEAGEVEILGKAATNLRDRLLIRLLFYLGCRVSEALGITVEDVDLARGTVIIQHLKTRMKLLCPDCSARLSKSHTYCPKCGTKVAKVVAEEKEHRRLRTLPIDDDTLGMLKDYIRRGGPVMRDGKESCLRHQSPQRLADSTGVRREGWPPRTG